MTNLEPVNSRKDNLTPRAKIGDVVIVKWEDNCYSQFIVESANYTNCWCYFLESDKKNGHFFDKDILKNLTTNISYE